MNRPACGLAILSTLILATASLPGADFSTYRGFTFGSDVRAAAKQAGEIASEVKTIHSRPAAIQEITWRVSSMADGRAADPVKEGVLGFLNGKLYRIVVYYDRYKVEGMTAQDLVAAISATYGVATKPLIEIPFESNYSDVAKVIARWENADYAYDLVRTGDQASFALVLYSKREEALAQAAMVEAARLDKIDAPRRLAEQERQRAEDERLSLEKARAANKPNFRP